MLQNTKICSNCGAVCDSNDASCPTCLHSFSKDTMYDAPVVDNIDNAELKEFVGKKSEYYVSKFAKAKGKKFFLQINFPSLFFGQNWFFYRKMYKPAIAFVIVSLLFSSILNICLPFIFKGTVVQFFSDKQAYVDYQKTDPDMFITNDEGYTVYNPEYDSSFSVNLSKSQNKIKTINFFIYFPVLILNILFRLSGNYFYKRHIIQNIADKSKGGTSVISVIVAIILIGIISAFVNKMVLNVPVVMYFNEALDSFYGGI